MIEKITEISKILIMIFFTTFFAVSVCTFTNFGPPITDATPYYLGAITNLDPNRDGLIAVNIGGTGAGTASGARTNLGAASSTHASTHFSSGTPGSDPITCPYGYVAQGDSGDELYCINTLPNPSIDLELSSDDTYSGVTATHDAGATISQWQPVFLDPDDANNEWQIADADSSGDAPAEGITTAACSDGVACIVLTNGAFRNDAWVGVWSDGQLLFLSDDPTDTTCTDDDCYGWTDTAPSTQYDVVQPLGRVKDTGSVCIIRVDINGISDWATVP